MNGVLNGPVLLSALLEGIAAAPAIPVRGLVSDSRSVGAGDVFVALKGLQFDGHAYLDDAARAGAAAALVERDVEADLPVVVLPELRQLLGSIASRFHGHPTRRMHVAAVTGTNGKTTISQLFAQLVRHCDYDCGVIGTLGASLDGSTGASSHTTPEPLALQATFADWASQAVPFAAMEASSHALDQWRLDGVAVDTAIFTNLTRDHLDYHGDMDSYGEAKARLFRFPGLRSAVINGDDPFARELLTALDPTVTPCIYGTGADADLRLDKLEQDAQGLTFDLHGAWGRRRVRTPLLGAFNALNVVAALGAAMGAGLPVDRLFEALPLLTAVPGRMEPLRRDGAPLVVIDYAHTPDALAKVLAALRAQCAGELVAVFGCGGDRDRGKRALMGEAVSAAADRAVITSDNPRSEAPLQIIEDVEQGMHGAYRVCADRAEAIELAIRSARPDDCVVIAGKGHEDYQIVGDEVRPFSDMNVARAVLEDYAS